MFWLDYPDARVTHGKVKDAKLDKGKNGSKQRNMKAPSVSQVFLQAIVLIRLLLERECFAWL